MLGPSRALGHRIRERDFEEAAKGAQRENQDSLAVVIIGGGIAGLSAGWWLAKHNIDFRILEMESEVGGNASSGKNEISRYPWGAHYVPLANIESKYVRQLFSELGVITAGAADDKPTYNELYLCHAPQERLFKDGTFQESLLPRRGLQPEDADEIKRFYTVMHKIKAEVGSDGKPAFAIPIELSSMDAKYRDLDKLSFAQWLSDNGFKGRPLRWYTDYCCKDDYGALAENVSAWAGIHYFAGRRGRASNAEENAIVTWPEGNGFLVNKLKELLADKIVTGSAVFSIKEKDGMVETSYIQDQGKAKILCSEKAIFCAPRFLAPYLIDGYKSESKKATYAPWLVGNISLSKLPSGNGIPSAWDNVSYYSQSLGYVVATHQNISTRQGKSVITYYYPLSQKEPSQARKELLSRSATDWFKLIVDDLEAMHPGIGANIISADLWPWGHGMVSPKVGYIWGDRLKLPGQFGAISFAHSDMSGISNFEEAQYRGIMAADEIIRNTASLSGKRG